MDDNKDLYIEVVALKASTATSSPSVLIVNTQEIHNEYDGILCDIHSELHLLKLKDCENTRRIDANLVISLQYELDKFKLDQIDSIEES